MLAKFFRLLGGTGNGLVERTVLAQAIANNAGKDSGGRFCSCALK